MLVRDTGIDQSACRNVGQKSGERPGAGRTGSARRWRARVRGISAFAGAIGSSFIDTRSGGVFRVGIRRCRGTGGPVPLAGSARLRAFGRRIVRREGERDAAPGPVLLRPDGVLRGFRGVLRGFRGVFVVPAVSFVVSAVSFLVSSVSFLVSSVSFVWSCCVGSSCLISVAFDCVALVPDASLRLDSGLPLGRLGSVRCRRPGHRSRRAVLRQINRCRRIRRGERHCQCRRCLRLEAARAADRPDRSAPARCPRDRRETSTASLIGSKTGN